MKIKSVLFVLVFSLVSCAVNAMSDEIVLQITNDHDLTENIMSRMANDSEENLIGISALTIALLNIEQMRNMVGVAINFNPPAGLEDNVNIPNDITLTDYQTRLLIATVFSPGVMRTQAQTFVQLRNSNHSFEEAMGAAEYINMTVIRATIPMVLQQNGAADNRPQQ